MSAAPTNGLELAPPALGPALALAIVALTSSTAYAEPQGTVGLTIGAAGEGYDHQFWKRRTAFHLGLHSDVLFGRTSTADFGMGPFAEVLTNGFDELQVGGGLSGLLPVIESFPMVLSAGGYARAASDGPVQPGVSGQLFWGARSYNFHSRYVLAGGVIAQMRYGLGPTRETAIIVGLQVDVLLLALPAIFVATVLRGASREAAPLP